MKKITCEFNLVDFTPGSLIESYQFSLGILSVEVKFFGAQVGEGEDIQFVDIPWGRLWFENVTFCQREHMVPDRNTDEEGILSTEKENLPEIPDDPNPEFTFVADSLMPEGRVSWDVKAARFKLEIEDGDFENLEKKGFNFKYV